MFPFPEARMNIFDRALNSKMEMRSRLVSMITFRRISQSRSLLPWCFANTRSRWMSTWRREKNRFYTWAHRWCAHCPSYHSQAINYILHILTFIHSDISCYLFSQKNCLIQSKLQRQQKRYNLTKHKLQDPPSSLLSRNAHVERAKRIRITTSTRIQPKSTIFQQSHALPIG